MAKKISYLAKNFNDYRNELIGFVKSYYPDLYSDFSDASVGSMLLELAAAIGDNLSYHIDRSFQETQLDYAQERRSLLAMARTLGLKVPGKRPSITILDMSFTVPVSGSTYDARYLPYVYRGSQLSGGGQVFENIDDIDFSSPYSSTGTPNRIIIPNINSSGTIVNYTITKRELVVNGQTRIFKRTISSLDTVPFLEIILPFTDVLSIESMIYKEGTDLTTNPTLDDFSNMSLRWFEVDALAQDKVYVEDLTKVSDSAALRPGRWMTVTRKFIKEYTDKGFCKLTFGSGSNTDDLLTTYLSQGLQIKASNLINNISLGEIPRAGTTLFIRYRTGGGKNSNIGVNTLTKVDLLDAVVNGPSVSISQAVLNSVKVNNAIPALGGADELSTEEVRKLISYNFSAQERCVTIPDYQLQIMKMPGEFGSPYKVGVWEEKNKVRVAIISLDENAKLNNVSNSTMKENIAEYLSNYRMLNDYIEVTDGKIINLAYAIDIYTDKNYNASEIIFNTIKRVQEYHQTDRFSMGDNIYLGNLIENINGVGGVLNVISIRAFNKVGSGYSVNQISQPYSDEATREIELIDYTLFADPDSMFEIKFPERDITVRVKN